MPRRAALSVLNALTALLIAPDLSSDLALSHFSPSSHHPKSLILAPKSPSHCISPKSPLTEGTHGTLKPRRAALGVLNALFMLLNPLRSLQNA